MTSNSTKLPVLGSDAEIAVSLLDEWFDPIEAGLRDRVLQSPVSTRVPPSFKLASMVFAAINLPVPMSD